MIRKSENRLSLGTHATIAKDTKRQRQAPGMCPQIMPRHLEAQASIRVDSSGAILAALAAIVRPASGKPDHESVYGDLSSDDNGHRDLEAAVSWQESTKPIRHSGAGFDRDRHLLAVEI
jgi:hypothetical protein